MTDTTSYAAIMNEIQGASGYDYLVATDDGNKPIGGSSDNMLVSEDRDDFLNRGSGLRAFDLLTKFSLKLSLASAIVLSSILAVFPSLALAQDTWGYCVTIGKKGKLARFTNIFHYPFSVSEYDLKPSAERFQFDINFGSNAASKCLVFSSESSAIKQRSMNVSAMKSIGSNAHVMDYNVKYKNYPSTPLPKATSKPAEQTAQISEESSPTPTSVKKPEVIKKQHVSQEQYVPKNNNSSLPVTQAKQPTRLSTQEAIRQAQAKTDRLNQANSYENQTSNPSTNETENQYVGSGRDYPFTGTSEMFFNYELAVDLAKTNLENQADKFCGNSWKTEIRWAQPVCKESASTEGEYKCSIDAKVNCYENRCSERFCGTGRKSLK